MEVYGQLVVGVRKGLKSHRFNLDFSEGDFPTIEKKSKLRSLTYTPVKKGLEKVVSDEALRRILKDADYLYNIQNSNQKEDPLCHYMKNGGLDRKKVFYYGRDMATCYAMQDVALDCMRYLALLETEYEPAAIEFILNYLQLRESPDYDLAELTKLAKSEAIIGVQLVVE